MYINNNLGATDDARGIRKGIHVLYMPLICISLPALRSVTHSTFFSITACSVFIHTGLRFSMVISS